MKFRAVMLAGLLILVSLTIVYGQEPTLPAMSLIGGEDAASPDSGDNITPTRTGFSLAAQERARQLGQTEVKILVIPTLLISNPLSLSATERQNLMTYAELQADTLEAACSSFDAAQALPCQASVLPIFMRTDALSTANQTAIAEDLSAIYFLDDKRSSDLAMRNLNNTPLERAIGDAYNRGVMIGGSGTGMDIQSFQLLAGYQVDFTPENALAFGAIDLQALPGPRGMGYGLTDAILQSDIFYAGRLGLLLNALADPESTNQGLGVDHYTGINLQGTELTRVYGEQTVLIVDGVTYHAAESAQYRGGLNYLSLRNVLVHALTAGETSYDLKTQSFGQNRAPELIERRFETLNLPADAGSLYLLSTLSDSWSASTLLNRFVNEAGGRNGRILHLLLGFPDSEASQARNEFISQMLGVPTIPLEITTATQPGFELDFTSYDAIILSLSGRQQFPEIQDKLAFLRGAWFAGKPILAAGEAAVVLGTNYLSNPNTALEASTNPELAFFDPALHPITQGLGLLPANIEISLTGSNRWGGLFSLANLNPGLITLGMAEHSAIILRRDQTSVDGENIVVSLDLRNAFVGEAGSGVRFTNGLLDVFAPGDKLEPRNADKSAAPVQPATPVIIYPSSTPTRTPTLTATPVPTNTPRFRPPTRTPRPSPTTPVSPPPRDPATSNLMIFLSLMMVVIVLLGVLINRPRFRKPKQ